MSNPEIVRLLRAIADVIEKSSPAEIAALTRSLKDSKSSRRRKATASENALELSRPNLDEIAEKLLAGSDRDQAMKLLADENLSRKELAALARNHNVHVVKEDSIGTIETKIVEALVGSRLNSRAIRGEQ